MPVRPRIPIHAGDPAEVFELEAKLLAAYRDVIARDIDDIIAKFPDPDDRSRAAKAFVAKIAHNIPDTTIAAAVERLAASKFRLRGIQV
jgi:hypothetical protein